ncbi:hypothetical protein LCI18_003567 [Fusarium solani-melongenae]|uniref:Uncharacterized protein n=1 Tax=Fusarium solani subsp. cucurbitae TaxID=2747967 RepID=A0ACD3YUQ6_FUSSC|nr:hypothetical protein LCI18_003567 [Fusarium solani-melongenae]
MDPMKLETFSDEGFVSLFDGKTLDGWHAAPRVYPGAPDDEEHIRLSTIAAGHPATWNANDGEIVGRQSTRPYGGYLVSDKAYGEFELVLEAKPDWPADTGVMLRRRPDSMHGLQLLLDHRQSGSIGGFYGNDIGGFHAVHFNVDVTRDSVGEPNGLQLQDPETTVEEITQAKRDLLSYTCEPEDFIKVWKWADWNELRVRCTGGALPVLTSWVNGLKVAELDVSRIKWPGFVAEDVASLLSPRGHIALEVHDNDRIMGDARWAEGAACRWRNIRIKKLD